MINKKIKILSYISIFVFMSLFYGCNIKSPSSYRGHLVFYENNLVINDPISSEKFLKIKNEVASLLIDYGFIEDEDMRSIDAFYLSKYKQVDSKFSDLYGSDAVCTVTVINFAHSFFDIRMKDLTNNFETEYFKTLKNEIILALKNKFGFSDIYFHETGEFLLNN